MARHLATNFHCWGIDLRAHGRSDSPADGDFSWSGFATDVLAVIDHLGLDHPYGFGHSCGGASVLLAEQRRPGAFRALYCYEPVVFPGPPPELEGNPMSDAARRRRETFPSATDAFLNFSSKPPFDDLDPDALQAYIDYGFETLPPEEGETARRFGCSVAGRTKPRSTPTPPPMMPTRISARSGAPFGSPPGITPGPRAAPFSRPMPSRSRPAPSKSWPGSAISARCNDPTGWPNRSSGRSINVSETPGS